MHVSVMNEVKSDARKGTRKRRFAPAPRAGGCHGERAEVRGAVRPLVFSSYTEVYSVIYDSRAVFLEEPSSLLLRPHQTYANPGSITQSNPC